MDFVLIATYNERENLLGLLPAIRQSHPAATICIVDDNSPDGTSRVPAELGLDRVEVLVRKNARGYGTAVRDGMLLCLRAGARRIVTMDADFSHDPKDLPAMFAALDHCDLAIGSRYSGGVRVLNWGAHRLMLSLFANSYVQRILGLRANDCTSGFRAYRRALLRRIALRKLNSTGYSFLVELLVRCTTAGARIHEVPIIYTERREGQSKMSNSVILESALMPWRLLLAMKLGRLGPRAR